MISWVVADSSIYLAVVLNEPLQSKAIALTQTWKSVGLQAAAPYLFRYEITSVLRKHVARGTLTNVEAEKALSGLLRAPVQMFSRQMLLKRAFQLARDHNRPAAYDTVYLALAEHLQCEFWTADMKLVHAVGAQLNWVKWLGNHD
jgi:predicted nucleic acid-binding protein